MTTNMTPFTEVESNGSKVGSPSKRPKREQHLLVATIILAIILLAFIIAVIVLAIKVAKHPTTTTATGGGAAEHTAPTTDNVCTTRGCFSTAIELLDSLDTNVDPCDDFYKFACGKWSSTYSGFGQSKIHKGGIDGYLELSGNIIAATNNKDYPAGVRKIANAYLICGKYSTLREEDKAWLLQVLQEVGGWPMTNKNWDEKRYHWERNLAQAIHGLLIYSPISVAIEFNPFDTRKRAIILRPNLRNQIVRLDKEKIIALAKILGNRDSSSIEREYEEMETFSNMLIKTSLFEDDYMDNPNERKLLTIRELNDLIPWVNWMEFFRSIIGSYLSSPLDDTEPVFVVGPSVLSNTLEALFRGNISKRVLANYIAASFIQGILEVKDVVPQNALLSTTDSFGTLSKAIPPQGFSLDCLTFMAKRASVAVDFINYKNRKIAVMDNKMMDYFLISLKDMINNANWLDEETKSIALEKLKLMKWFSGFPGKAKDGKIVEEYFIGLPNMTENTLRNQLEIQRHFFKKQVEMLHEPVDRNSWPIMDSSEGSQINAFYAFELNAILIPAGIQMESTFAPERPKYWNFGSFGWIIGHECNHGFDTKGSKRDQHGNLRNWWTPKTKKEFERRSNCFIEQYNKIPIGYKDYHVNGTMGSGENVADNIGLRQAFFAYKLWEKDHGKEKPIPGLEYDTNQLFFIATAQPYCSLKVEPEEFYNSAVNDPHTPMQFRFNAAASNFEDFATTFKCKPGTPMNPTKKCVIW